MRSVPEWQGKTHDTHIPTRVKVRVFDRFAGCCAICGRHIRGSLLAVYDHRIALINNGANRESNLQLLCHECNKPKTRRDLREKSINYHKRIKRMKLKSRHRPMMGSKASGWKKTFNRGWVKR